MLNRTVDTNEYVSVLRELVEQEKEVGLLIAGNSMSPFLVHQRDTICFRKPDKKLRRGDMVFYQRENGHYIMHRIYKVCPEGYYMVGDAQVAIEGPLRAEQIFAIVTKVNRKGKWIGPNDLWWRFFAHVWIRIVPMRRMILKGYSVLTRRGR
ncbi:MAG: S24/S26 family peptidase [Faecalimonas sp.]|nr:S24/S26 family peptidase [Faecalimonas sp.]